MAKFLRTVDTKLPKTAPDGATPSGTVGDKLKGDETTKEAINTPGGEVAAAPAAAAAEPLGAAGEPTKVVDPVEGANEAEKGEESGPPTKVLAAV